MVDKDKIMVLLTKHFNWTGTATVDDQGFVSCTGNVLRLSSSRVQKLPVKFLHVAGRFDMSKSSLRTLEGSPQQCEKFVCTGSKYLTSLQGAPKIATKFVGLDSCSLLDLRGCPQTSHLSVDWNPLTSLEGMPDNLDRIEVTWRQRLPVLRLITAKQIILGWGNHDYVIVAPLQKILDKYAGTTNPGDILRCASELTEAGFEGNAEW